MLKQSEQSQTTPTWRRELVDFIRDPRLSFCALAFAAVQQPVLLWVSHGMPLWGAIAMQMVYFGAAFRLYRLIHEVANG